MRAASLITRLRWTGFPLVSENEIPGWKHPLHPDPGPVTWQVGKVASCEFRAKYLVVTTLGFKIVRVLVGHGRMVLDEIDGDTYYRDEWDRLERCGQLDRVRLDFAVASGDYVAIQVQNRNIQAKQFRAALIGIESEVVG